MLNKDDINTIGSYKIRKSGNSDITTVPKDVKETLDLETGDQIEYIIDSKGSVSLRKKIEKQDIDALIAESVAQYHELLEELVEK
ncbi:MAG: addiction module antitoxin [Alkalibacterium sp.]|uniref:Putative addiction module antidote n=1 Tax=Alkalibacterium gilvum TaxID=1130080 RepID=A0A1H6TA92_9LACT|nr:MULTISPECIES: AbrB/MazE/SpoVT family DNA-binding domain-containing protein [Alkalibacterium]MDN6293353.1 addiction module antitoxin [Alkalibacterium sp.]MDN6295659.1 addiction module antitoxin [Alkalibacterium sp.]MDN6729547.1 addiction module antitoxin [Alkalibacterium sp.]SEI75074.1 putative addiction module antidote [Alkalibacterium gilvum]